MKASKHILRCWPPACLAFPLLFSASCQPYKAPPYQMQNSFIYADAEPYLAAGDSAITGSAFLRLWIWRGAAQTFAARAVELCPATPYFVELWENWGRTLDKLVVTRTGAELRQISIPIEPDMPEEAKRFVRVAACDASGNFEFAALPPGDYLLRCEIQWRPDPSSARYQMEILSGGSEKIHAYLFKAKVELAERESKEILLTQPEPMAPARNP